MNETGALGAVDGLGSFVGAEIYLNFFLGGVARGKWEGGVGGLGSEIVSRGDHLELFEANNRKQGQTRANKLPPIHSVRQLFGIGLQESGLLGVPEKNVELSVEPVEIFRDGES